MIFDFSLMNENIPIIFVVNEFDDDVFRIYPFPTIVLNQSIFTFIISFKTILKQTTLLEYTV